MGTTQQAQSCHNACDDSSTLRSVRLYRMSHVPHLTACRSQHAAGGALITLVVLWYTTRQGVTKRQALDHSVLGQATRTPTSTPNLWLLCRRQLWRARWAWRTLQCPSTASSAQPLAMAAPCPRCALFFVGFFAFAFCRVVRVLSCRCVVHNVVCAHAGAQMGMQQAAVYGSNLLRAFTFE